jgi:serine/threonine protein phosphatase PrpC
MKDDVPKLLSTTFMKTEALLRMLGASDIGATCCSAYFCQEEGHKTIYFANLGDTRAILDYNG